MHLFLPRLNFPAVAATVTALLAACGPSAATPESSFVLDSASRVAIASTGEHLVVGGGAVAWEQTVPLTITKIGAEGERLFHQALPTGPRDGLTAEALRATAAGGALVLTRQLDDSPLGLPVRSTLLSVDATGATSWRVELAAISGGVEARDLHVLGDARALVGVGAELQTFGEDGTLVARDDLGARLGVTFIEELEPLAGGLAVLAAIERSPADLSIDLDYQVIVLDAAGAEDWRFDIDALGLAHTNLSVAPDGGLYVIESLLGRGDDVALPDPSRLTALAADGTQRWSVEPGVDVRWVERLGTELVTLEYRQLGDDEDAEGRPDDFGFVLTHRWDVDGTSGSELFLGSTEELTIDDLIVSSDATISIVGDFDGRSVPMLQTFRLP